MALPITDQSLRPFSFHHGFLLVFDSLLQSRTVICELVGPCWAPVFSNQRYSVMEKASQVDRQLVKGVPLNFLSDHCVKRIALCVNVSVCHADDSS
jgi:hypothetical protein